MIILCHLRNLGGWFVTEFALVVLREFGLFAVICLILLWGIGRVAKPFVDAHIGLVKALQKNADKQTETLAKIASTQGEIVALLREKQPCTHAKIET